MLEEVHNYIGNTDTCTQLACNSSFSQYAVLSATSFETTRQKLSQARSFGRNARLFLLAMHGTFSASIYEVYEAKHSYFKKLSQNIGNFINLPYTLAIRHQKLQCYYGIGKVLVL